MATKKKSKKSAKKTVGLKKAAAKKPKAAAKKPVAKKAARKAPPRKPAAPKPPHVAHPVMHWEIQSQRPAELHAFYKDVLGWAIDADNPMNYGMVTSGGAKGINGGIGGSQAPGSRVVVYAEVPKIEPVLERITSLGGAVVMPRTDLGMVIFAIYLDPEGNTMGLIEPR
jgi:predicted enzyme related to lactoylglutathione lyase